MSGTDAFAFIPSPGPGDKTPGDVYGSKYRGMTWEQYGVYQRRLWSGFCFDYELRLLGGAVIGWYYANVHIGMKCVMIPVSGKGITAAMASCGDWPKDYPPWGIPPSPNDPLQSWQAAQSLGSFLGGGGFMPPIVVDLYGNGIETISLDHGPFFDYNGDGLAERTGWVTPTAGILCMDLNGNGTVDDVSELFGDQTLLSDGQLAVNGFQALAALDSNQDGKIDAQDPAYSQLRVWSNSSGDGNWQEDELFTLPQLGIESIDLNWTTVNTTDSQGNIQMSAGSFDQADGTTSLIAEYAFQTKPCFSTPSQILALPDDIAALPDINGAGTVYPLQQAMVRDTSGQLEALVKQFAAENDPNSRTALVDQILFQWTGSENVDPVSRGGSIDARKVAVLDAFMGKQWSSTVAYQGNYGNPNPGASVVLDSLYHDISAGVYCMLMAQTHFKDLL